MYKIVQWVEPLYETKGRVGTPRKIKETIHSLKNPITLTKFSTCFLKYGFLIYGSS